VVVQDEATSVVWGMPGSAVEAGLADEVMPLGAIAEAVAQLVAGADAD
jgi:two-component system chemotaxis response regulator CheB